MQSSRLIFVSAVSNEFHRSSTEQWRDFQSYRDVIKHAFHNLDRSYKVLTQEDLVPGFSGLLQTLDPLKNLGKLFMKIDRLDEAEPLIRRALAIEEHSYGPNAQGRSVLGI